MISPSEEDEQTFTVSAANGEVYRLRAQGPKERQQWVSRLRSVVEKQVGVVSATVCYCFISEPFQRCLILGA